jgi:hypothetical protein
MGSWLFPRQGGGWARRYLWFRRDLLQRSWQTKDRYPCSPITLFDFKREHDAADAARVLEKELDTWRISDDRVIGGFSEGSAVLLRSQEDYDRHVSGQPLTLDEEREPNNVDSLSADAEEEGSGADPNFTPFLRWNGQIDTTVGLQSSAQRSGFAALRSPEFPFNGANLQGLYNALELTCRSDGRIYTLNLKVASSIPNDMYQGKIQASPPSRDAPFERFILPFASLQLTSMGREREVSRILDDNISIESLGVALMDSQDGGFQFDLARIRAVNVQEEYGVFEGPPEEIDST